MARARYLALAVLLGLSCVLQFLLIVPVALVVFPFVLVAGVRVPRSRERRVMSPTDPPDNQSTGRNT